MNQTSAKRYDLRVYVILFCHFVCDNLHVEETISVYIFLNMYFTNFLSENLISAYYCKMILSYKCVLYFPLFMLFKAKEFLTCTFMSLTHYDTLRPVLGDHCHERPPDLEAKNENLRTLKYLELSGMYTYFWHDGKYMYR